MSKIDDIIEREGREYTDRPNDKGGPTKFGITLKTLEAWRKEQVDADDVANLTEEEAREIYQEVYVDKSPFVNVRPLLRDMLDDWAVTSGPDDPTTALQRLLIEYGAELKVDGVFGKNTEKALDVFIAQWGENLVYNKLIDARVLFYCGLVSKDHSQAENCLGWTKRALSFRKY